MSDERTRSRTVGGKHKGTLLSVRVGDAMRAAIREHRTRLQADAPYAGFRTATSVRDLIIKDNDIRLPELRTRTAAVSP